MQQEGNVSSGKAGRQGGARALRHDRLASVSVAYDAWGRRTRRTIRFLDGGGETVDGRRAYDRYGRLVEIAASGTTVRYAYDGRGRVARQTVDGTPIDFAYTRDGRLAGKYLGGRLAPEASVEYEYTGDGRIAARTANGVRQSYEYDARGRLLAVKEDGADVERYAYDRAGNMVRKTVRGKTTTFTFDGANQLVSSTTDGVTTRYAYDAAGRLVREGTKTYRYGWLDKVLAVSDGDGTRTFGWHVDGQLASVTYGGRTEDFTWDGLALVRRGGESFVNEPHLGGGAAVWSSGGGVLFNDLLATTLGAQGEDGAYTPFARTSFGEDMPRPSGSSGQSHSFFTGKPHVEGLGHAFLLRAYRPDLGKWLVADPLGYPDGWNQLAYCNNRVTDAVDWLGGATIGDTKPVVGYESLPDDLVKYTMAGFTPDYVPCGYDIEIGEFRAGVYIENSMYLKEDNGIYKEYWGKFKDEQDVESWGIYDCIVTIKKDTALSELFKYTGEIGEIGGWLGVFLKTNPWYDASMGVAAAMKNLQTTMQDTQSIRLGQTSRLDSITPVVVCGPYDGFLFRRYRQEIIE